MSVPKVRFSFRSSVHGTMPVVNVWEKLIPDPGLRDKLRAFYQIRVPPFVKRWGPALLLMAVIFAFSSIPSEEMPNLGVFDLSVKKLGHAIGYALLSLAYSRGLGRKTPRPFLLAWLMAILYAATDEFHQSFVHGRGSRITDVGVDAIGAGFSLLLVMFLSKKSAGEG